MRQPVKELLTPDQPFKKGGVFTMSCVSMAGGLNFGGMGLPFAVSEGGLGLRGVQRHECNIFVGVDVVFAVALCCCCRFCCCCICCCTASFAIPLLLAHLPCISQLQDALYERVINTFTQIQKLFAALLFTRSVMTSYSHEVNSGPDVEVDFHAKGDQCSGSCCVCRTATHVNRVLHS